MKIGFLNRNPHTHPGGDVIMLEHLMHALKLLGIDCTNVYGDWQPEWLHLYDLVVIYHMNFTWSWENISKTIASRRPFVILPIFYPTDQLGMSYAQMKLAMDLAKAVCPLSFTEAREITERTCYQGPFTIIPHGTEQRFHCDLPSSERKYVLAANARGDKGEEHVGNVCKRLGIPYHYARLAPHEKMHEIYRDARVYVHSSLDDRMSLTVGEALCSGCRVLSSDRDRGNEWFPGLKVVNPENEMDLEAWVRMAWESEQWDETPNQYARTLSWERAAKAWLGVFRRVLGCS